MTMTVMMVTMIMMKMMIFLLRRWRGETNDAKLAEEEDMEQEQEEVEVGVMAEVREVGAWLRLFGVREGR